MLVRGEHRYDILHTPFVLITWGIKESAIKFQLYLAPISTITVHQQGHDIGLDGARERPRLDMSMLDVCREGLKGWHGFLKSVFSISHTTNTIALRSSPQ